MLKSLKIAVLGSLFSLCVFGQINTLTQTTLASAALSTDKVIFLTSTTNVNVPSLQAGTVASQLYVVAPGNQRGEVMTVQGMNGQGVNVRRNNGGAATAFPAGSMVLIGPPNQFYDYDPSGGCTASSTFVTPYVNVKSGNQWLCSTVTNSWVPGFNNDAALDTPTAPVAAAAGLITPSGPLFHLTGTGAITGFNLPLGFAFGTICAIPDGLWTTTNANNFAIASTAVVSKVECWTYDPSTAKFYPSY